MASQKFHRGDRVLVARDLGTSMKHFSGAGCEALVEGSYEDLCHGRTSGEKSYGLYIFDGGKRPHSSSWYYESQLSLVKKRTLKSIEEVERLRRGE